MGVRVRQEPSKPIEAALFILQHLVVPETEDAITFGFDGQCTRMIPLDRVLPAIDFNHDPKSMAGEIGNVVAQRNLPTKARFGELLPE